MEIRKQDDAFAHEWKLGCLRLFDLHDHVGLLPNFFGGLDDGRAGGLIGSVGQAAAEARAFLNENSMIASHESGYSGGSNGDTILLGFDLLGDADDHIKRLNDGGGKGKSKKAKVKIEKCWKVFVS